MNQKYEKISTEIIYSNPYWDYRLDKYILPNGRTGKYFYVDSRGACMVIPVLEKNTFVMVRQYRYLNQRFSIEFPGGGLSKGKGNRENALDELREEAGYLAKDIELIGEFNPYNGVTNELCSVFLASGLSKTAVAPEESEELEILILNEDEIINKIRNKEIWDGMTLASWSLYFFQKQMEN